MDSRCRNKMKTPNGIETKDSGGKSLLRLVLPALIVILFVLANASPSPAATVLNLSEFDGSAGTYWTAGSNSARTWVFDANTTPSSNVGPAGPKSGTQYIYTEASSGAAGDEWYLTSANIDASTWDATLNFWYNKYHNSTTSCNLQVQVSTNGGTSWSAPLWTTNINQGVGGTSGTNWLNQSVDLSGYDGTIKVRFKAASNGAYQCDTALDKVQVSAEPACISTTGPPLITTPAIKVNGNPVDLCEAYDLNGSGLSNITITSGGSELYDGISCRDINTAGWPSGTPPEPSYTSLDINILAQDNCGLPQFGSGTFQYSACVSTTGPIRVIDDTVLSGTTTDITRAIEANNANLNSVKVYKVVGTGTDIDETENFIIGGLEGWGSNWTPTGPDGVTAQGSPPENGDLATGFFTRTEDTGPSAPYDGDFIFYEASTGAGTDRYLVNGTLYDAGNHELKISFKYLMNGADVGTLELQAKNPNYNGGVWTTEWSDNGNKGDVWKTGTVDLHAGDGDSATAYTAGNTQLRFRFVYGGGNLGDIALDAIHITGPRSVDPTPLFDGDGAGARNASTAGWPDGGVIRINAEGTNDCAGELKDWGFATFKADAVKPTLNSFLMPGISLSPIQVFNMAATDNDGGSGIAGYLVTETAATPSATDPNWSTTPPLRVSTANTGTVTFYGWAKDHARNISTPLSRTVTINADVNAPVISNFVMPTISFSPIPVSAFAATDDSGLVTGYMINESATQPAAAAAGWLPNPPTSFVTTSSGPTTFYAWAKDSAGNVSPATELSSRTVDVKVDVNAPVVTFDLPASHDSYIIPVTTFLAGDTTGGTADNTGVAAYLITTTSAKPSVDDPSWRGTPQTSLTVKTDGAHTFWAWAKDNAGNISGGVSDSVTITLPPTCNFAVDMAGTLVETENYTSMGAPAPWAWDTIMTPLADTSVQSTLNNGGGDLSSGGYIVTATGGTGSTPQGSRADYPLFFTTSGTYCIWIRGMDAAGFSGGDSNFWGIDGSYVGAMTQSVDNQWAWTNGLQNGAKCTYIQGADGNPNASGAVEYPVGSGTYGIWHTINLWPREEGQKNDMFLLTTNSSSNAGGLFSGNNDQATVIPGGAEVIDPTCVDSSGGGVPGSGGSGDYITIPDSQSVIGSPVDVERLYNSSLPNPLEYRALGAQSDGFEHFAVDHKWDYTNVGNDAMDPDAVAVSEGQGVLRLTGSGADIWGSTDYFSYLYQPGISGDFTIDVKVKTLVDRATGGVASQNSSAKAGIMVRQSLATNSRNVMINVTDAVGARLQSRATDGGITSYINGTNAVTAGADTWLRLRRSGSTFEGFYSTNNGASWTSTGTTNVTMTGSVVIGLGVTSHDTTRDSVATFDNFLFMPKGVSGMSETWTSTATDLVTNLPQSWTEQDYALAVRGSGGAGKPYQCNSFGFNPCVDSTPSTLTINNAEVVGGTVSLNSLFDYGGNPTGFKYEINGNTVLNPWNSYSLVPNGTSANITFKVSATDPDCGGSAISASGTVIVDNTCSDPTPSTITILSGQITGGPTVDLTKMFTATGNVATVGFSYKINGVVVGDPTSWDSRAYGNQSGEAVTLEVSSVDPDCGIGVSGLNQLTVDNSCVRNPPSISFNLDEGHVGASRTLPYSVTIRNEDSWNCGPSTFDVAIVNETNGTDFDPAFFNPLGSNQNIFLDGRDSTTIELAVPAKATAAEWNSTQTTVEITSSFAGAHHAPKTTGTVTTKVFLVSPITHNSVTTGSNKWGGTWGTSETGSKYGNFDCLICHEKNGPGIKWMRDEVHLPGADWGTGSTPEHLPVDFDDAVSGPAVPTQPSEDNDWGNDDPAGTDIGEANSNGGPGRTSSTRACEVCHTQTQYHRFNTSGQTELNHFNGRDCTDCHRHSLGFTAGCTGCHGDPPLRSEVGGPTGLADIPGKTGSVTPGTHYKHVEVLNYPCEYCHAGWRNVGEMPKAVGDLYQINHKFNVFFDKGMSDPTKDNGHYTGQDGVNYEPVPEAIAEGRQNADGTIPAGKGSLTCENIYCHGGTESMGGTNPQWNGNITCNSCHGTSAANTPPGYSHTTHVGKRGLACTDCHAVPEGRVPGYNGHVNGRVLIDMSHLPSRNGTPRYNGVNGAYISATVYESNAAGDDMPPSNTYGTCSNVACHFGTETPIWNSGEPATCTTCHHNGSDDGVLTHAAPNSGNHEQHVNPLGSIHERMIGTYVNKCESCHGGGANEGEHPGHIDFAATVGGGMTFDGTTCTSVCHDAKHISWGSPNPLSCEACHMAPYLGPTVVDPDGEGTGLAASGFGSHLKAATGEVVDGNTNWDTQCRKCHPYHDGGVTIPLPASGWDQLGNGTDMAYKLGLQYPVSMGIHLGGTATSKTTEAEICWECHDANGISEWGDNNNAMTGNMVYNYGSVTTSNWTSAVWTSGEATFGYKTASIASTHAANISVVSGETSRSGVDDVGGIRCTYCHDVHDLNRGMVDTHSGTTEMLTGQPYLRGSWLGNPYKEDGAPQAGTSYTNFSTDPYGQVPRGSKDATQKMGGYWIDQNSGDPLAGDLTYDDFGGLCKMCHGSDVNSLNQYGADGAGWVSGYNGHANSVKGGAGGGGVTARNIFNDTDRGGGSTSSYSGSMAYWGMTEPGENNGGMRGGDGDSFSITPGVDGYGNEPCANTNRNCGGNTYFNVWDDLRPMTVKGTSTGAPDNNYHTFSCSKCHNPHASRLPKLMITNCLDTKHNQWDNNIQAGTSGPTVTDNVTASNWTTAQNCHRLAGKNDPFDTNDVNTNAKGSGWNLVTPWSDGDANYGTHADKAQDNTGAW